MNSNTQTTSTQNQISNIEHALSDFRKTLGNDYVVSDPLTVNRYGRSGNGSFREPLAVLRPGDVPEVIKIIEIAQNNSIPLFPVSRGKNWGYGATAPTTSHNVIVDLSRMNRIIEVNEELAYAVVEPGVTQQQLYDYIQERKLPLTFDVTGSATSASLVGNLVERGYGATRYGDHYLNSAGMEVILGDGTVLQTGFGHLSNTRTAYIYKPGVGPALDGIFTQSNYGIVTKVGVWLLPEPENFSVILAQLDSDKDLTLAMDKLRALKLRGSFPAAVHIANDLRIISVLQNYPYNEAKSPDCLSEDERKKLQKKWGFGEWNLLASMDGTRAQIAANLALIKKTLDGLCRIQSFSERTVSFCAKYSWLARLLRQTDLKTKLSVLRLMKGVPSDAATRSVYWRKKEVPQSDYDPIGHNCGVMWCSPIIPMTSRDTTIFLDCLRSVHAEFNLDVNVSITLLTERACCCTIGFLYDLNDTEETSRAKSCYKKLMNQLISLGYPPYRLSSDTDSVQETLLRREDPFNEVCSRIKSVLDPSGIIAPGKYGIF